MRILVTGGAGYIGSVVTEQLLLAGHAVVVLDNLSQGHRAAVPAKVEFVQADLLDDGILFELLGTRKIETVIHMAAYASVAESVEKPAHYHRNNVLGGIKLLEAMRAAAVKRIIFSSSAAVYGEPKQQPIEESAPTQPTNPYGATKLEFEKALKTEEELYGTRYVSLRYFNAAGATEKCGEVHDPETHLIPLALQVAAGLREFIEIYGDDYPTSDGTCIRDYIHVVDLARAHLLALESAEESAIYNLGCGADGYSVSEVIDTVREVTGKDVPVRLASRRPGDPTKLVATSEKIKSELGWEPEFQDLRVIIESAWKWMLAHPRGYESK
jgi:UDP-glucose 4-epimerase